MSHRTAKRTIKSPRIWAQARRDYADGDPAAEVCERYGLGLSTLRARAAAERWRRCDEPENDPPTPDEKLEQRRFKASELTGLACSRLDWAIRANRVRDAQSWSRVLDQLFTLAAWADDMEHNSATVQRLIANFREGLAAAKAENARAPEVPAQSGSSCRPVPEPEPQPDAPREPLPDETPRDPDETPPDAPEETMGTPSTLGGRDDADALDGVSEGKTTSGPVNAAIDRHQLRLAAAGRMALSAPPTGPTSDGPRVRSL